MAAPAQASPASKAAKNDWEPHSSLTTPPTNLKEAIDWVLRVTGKDGKDNEKKNDKISCLCLLAKAVKDLLYDAGIQYSTESTSRDYTEVLLKEERDIVKPVLSDLGLDNVTYNGCGATEVIGTLIDQLALGLQKWVGWQDKGKHSSETIRYCDGSGIGKKWSSGNTEQEYRSSYDDCVGRHNGGSSGSSSSTTKDYLWTTFSEKPVHVHLLARIFLGSVCLIWSGLSQLGFLTGGSGKDRWKESSLYDISDANAGLGSLMAAMGYDLDRLNQGSGYFLWSLLSGKNGKPGVFNEFTKNSADKSSVAEYYSSIYENAKSTSKTSETVCKEYPLLVLHILASGYFRAGSAGTNKITTPPTKKTQGKNDTAKKDTPRKPQSIREILYWLSALPYSQGYCGLVRRMDGKMKDLLPKEEQNKQNILQLHGENSGKTELKKGCLTHYLLAACGYCPLVLIGIQGTIEKEVIQLQSPGQAVDSTDKKCPHHKGNRNHRCDPKNIKEEQASKSQSDGKLKEGQVCYKGYHLAVKDFGPLHGMYANGLFGFQMDTSPAQCLDQLRVYVYHCFYQLYFLRNQCGAEAVLGWKSCRYGFQVGKKSGNLRETWQCTGTAGSDHAKKCGIFDGTSNRTESPLQSFLCDRIGSMRCKNIIGKSNVEEYPEIKEHMDPEDISPLGHIGKPPMHCPVPMGWQQDGQDMNHFKDLNKTHKTDKLEDGKGSGVTPGIYPIHCTGNTLSYLLEYYCDPGHCTSGSLVVLLRLLACITPTVPRTLGDLFGFYYYIVYIGGKNNVGGGGEGVYEKLKGLEEEVVLYMGKGDAVVTALTTWSSGGDCSSGGCKDTLKCLIDCSKGSPFLSPLSGQQYGQLSPVMAETYLSWLVYLIEDFKKGLEDLKGEFMKVDCKGDNCKGTGSAGCNGSECKIGKHGEKNSNNVDNGVCCCASVVSCTGVLPVLYKYGFVYGDVRELHKTSGTGSAGQKNKQCHNFLETLTKVLGGEHLKKEGSKGHLHHEINQLIYTTRLPWIFVLTVAWLIAVLYLAFGAIWPLDWTHMRSHCRGWFRKGSLSPWEVLMVDKKKGRGILEFFGGK